MGVVAFFTDCVHCSRRGRRSPAKSHVWIVYLFTHGVRYAVCESCCSELGCYIDVDEFISCGFGSQASSLPAHRAHFGFHWDRASALSLPFFRTRAGRPESGDVDSPAPTKPRRPRASLGDPMLGGASLLPRVKYPSTFFLSAREAVKFIWYGCRRLLHSLRSLLETREELASQAS